MPSAAVGRAAPANKRWSSPIAPRLSPHDQWFFHHASDMVHGVVKAPTLDLANRDLVESHLHAVWLHLRTG